MEPWLTFYCSVTCVSGPWKVAAGDSWWPYFSYTSWDRSSKVYTNSRHHSQTNGNTQDYTASQSDTKTEDTSTSTLLWASVWHCSKNIKTRVFLYFHSSAWLPCSEIATWVLFLRVTIWSTTLLELHLDIIFGKFVINGLAIILTWEYSAWHSTKEHNLYRQNVRVALVISISMSRINSWSNKNNRCDYI